MQFADVLASSIHDIKNALGMVINTLDEIASGPDACLAGNPKVVSLQLEARRANNDLIQLLTLYNMENKRVTPNMAECNLEDYLDEIVAEHRELGAARGIEIDYACDPYLSAYFDADLVAGVLNNAIGNAERYTRSRIHLSADIVDEYLVIRVEDDGDGFPQAMLELQHDPSPSQGFSRGRTQLGLFFSSQVAGIHCNGERKGYVRMQNRCNLDGGCFSLCLP